MIKRMCLAALVAALLSVSFSFVSFSQFLDEAEWELVRLVNSYRQQNGLQSVAVSPTLTVAAEFHSAWMANNNCFSHRCGFEPDLGQRLSNARYQWRSAAAENIAAGNINAQRTFMQWVTSPPHNDALLDPRWQAIGIAREYNFDSSFRWYWTLDFGDVVDSSLVRPESLGAVGPFPQAMSAPANIKVFNLAGELVFESGWRNGADVNNLSFVRNRLANGVYLYTVQVQGQPARNALKKLVVLN